MEHSNQLMNMSLEDEEDGAAEAAPSNARYVAAGKGNEGLSKPPKPNAQLTYCIAKTPSVHNASVSNIISEYHATSFLPALSRYLKLTAFSSSYATPLPTNQFDLYKQVQIEKGYLPAVANGDMDRMRVVSDVEESRNEASTPAHFDMALVRYKPENKYMQGTALEGLRIMQVRVIFDLPAQFGLQTLQSTSRPVTPVCLVYVEWFKTFHHPHPLTGMYVISCTRQNRLPYAKILPLERVVGSVHLTPQFGTCMDQRLKHTSILEECPLFFY
jgi:hypothetical protein